MTLARTIESPPQRGLRLWPGIVAAALLVLVRFGMPLGFPEFGMFAVLGGVAAGLAVGVWWMFFSRAPWSERLGTMFLLIVAALAIRYLVHESLRGMLLLYLVAPGFALALVAGVVAGRRLAPRPRQAAALASILVGCGTFMLLRTDGVSGAGVAQFRWRWTPTAEERLLSQAGTEAAADVPAPAIGGTPAGSSREWTGFRGPRRDGIVRDIRIETDWAKSPPVALWRSPIGPGWSSFAVAGDLLYTQEQRGDDEMVTCYHMATGKPVWAHGDAARFTEAGTGPRGTPFVHDGRVYTLGATGVVNALDAATGAVLWSRNALADTGAPLPDWGFSGSPLVVDDLVIVAASGRLVGYDAATGNPRWTQRTAGGGYSSPHLITMDGLPQVLLVSGSGATSVSPTDGTQLWQFSGTEGSSIVQPALIANGEFLVASGDIFGGVGMRRIAVSRGPSGWNVEERWTSRGLKPFFNDFVVHEGHAYGFDGTILACIDIADGTRKWKGGRYGAGQMLLLSDQGLLLVLSENGELGLIRASPDKFEEVARLEAIEGKTWNHPALVDDILLVRNAEEMAAFRLPLSSADRSMPGTPSAIHGR